MGIRENEDDLGYFGSLEIPDEDIPEWNFPKTVGINDTIRQIRSLEAYVPVDWEH
jgi:hypothetical protein